MPDILARLDQYASITAYEFDEITANSPRITGLGTYYASEFYENVGIGTTLTANVFAPYDPVYDDFGGTLFGPGQGRYMRQNTDKSVVIYNEINEIDLFVTNIPTSGLQLYIDAGISTSVTIVPPIGQQAYTTPGTTNFVVPDGVTSISAVCVGGGGGGAGSDSRPGDGMGGGGGGALCYGTIAVTPGEILSVTVGTGGNGGGTGGAAGSTGGLSRISRGATNLLTANGGNGGVYRDTTATAQSTFSADASVTSSGGGNGGGAGGSPTNGGSGGGGAGGYGGAGGTGGGTAAPTAGSNGGGGGGGNITSGGNARAWGGGGTGILGSGAGGDGTVGTNGSTAGGGGSGGSTGSNGTPNTGTYGGGGGAADTDGTFAGGAGAGGAVRIIWGTGRSYPSTLVADQTTTIQGYALADLSGNGRTGITTNGASYSSIIREGSVVFDGTNDYVTHSAYKGITGTGARTAIIWFQASVPNIAYRLFGWGTTASGGKWNISLDATTFRPRVEISTGSVLANTSAPNVTNGEWYMIAASAPASGTASSIKLYIDGNLITDTTITSGATAINTISGSDVSFGASLADAAPGYLNGGVSQFLIYNRQLTDLEILQIYKIISTRFFI